MSTGLFPGSVVDVMAGAAGCVIEEDAGSQGTQAFRKLKRCGEGPPRSLQKEPARLQWAWDAQSCGRGKGCGVSSTLGVRAAARGGDAGAAAGWARLGRRALVLVLRAVG